jgi:hypothetical protein
MHQPQRYDPYQLIEDVAVLLRQRGLDPVRLDGQAGERLAGAAMLLRGLGAEPLMSQQAALDLDGHTRYVARVHGD